ncbi:hypothetical protein MJO28_013562 [Puccinia striiformis f. sp. tritici]|uniref:Uncharacterized protein n=4 Tax=Puccinia striiformis TaxID=27350 RepID=A0A0L0VWE0_9BASI|nr:hypothetical protein MJO28_013562 [Puccinia striiformis f. sp. tritici]KAI9629178.1 hypothetical protein KEM48_011024 [Puccinia striiformis f. sp. tritici PST-130]KNF03583.1 hypothetical protein PSTG_03106 [Puccinia striiformis f. sp. tritici PST-78]POW14484.1 hypothetical protein PSTT_02982 [Puccinia striiformis]KAI7941318.1 hypothetical protein MJO29_013392 [Puccinia striiformis f. sp. tritici]
MGIDPSPHSSIRRAHATNNHRQSLAFELAAAMDPEENDQASILDQLGLGDDDEDDINDDDDLNGGGLGEDQDESDHQIDDQEDTTYEGEEYPGHNRFDSVDHQSSTLQFLEPERMIRSQSSRSTIASTNKRSSIICSPRKASSTREASLSTPMKTLGRELSRSTLNTINSTSSHSNLDIRDLDHQSGGHPNDLYRDPAQIDRDDQDQEDQEDGIFGFSSLRSQDDHLDSSSEDEDAEILEAGLKSTAKFLNLLKQSNIDCPASSPLINKVPQNEREPTRPPTPTTPTKKKTLEAEVEQNISDRQPVVEKMITDIVRTMTEQVRDRESQIRELKEIEIALSRTDRRFLADLDELPNLFEEEEDFRNSMILGKSLVVPSDLPSISIDGLPKPIDELEDLDPHEIDDEDHQLIVEEEEEEEDEEEIEGGRSTPMATKRIAGQTELTTEQAKEDIKNRPIENLGELKLITNSLINSLNQIHEHTQISRQTQIEIARKLKGVKGLVSNWKTDFDSVQNSIDFISNWEFDQFKSPSNSIVSSENSAPFDHFRDHKIRGIFEVQVKLATSEVEKLLNEAFTNANTLLQPHLSPISPPLIKS